MPEREDIVEYLRSCSTGLIQCAISDYIKPEQWRQLSGTARAIDDIARLIENGEHRGEEDLEA